VRDNEQAFAVLEIIGPAVGGVFPPAHALAPAIAMLRNDCDVGRSFQQLCRDSVIACDVVSVACLIAGVAASLGIVTIPVGVSLGAIAGACQALRVVFVSLGEGRAPRLSDALGAVGALLGIGGDQTREAAKLVKNVPASEIQKMATATTVELLRYPFPLRRGGFLRKVISSANAAPGVDVRDIVLSELAVLQASDMPKIQKVLAQKALLPRLRRDSVMLKNKPAAEVLAGYLREAEEALQWFKDLAAVPRNSLPWGIDTAKVVVADPRRAPGADLGGRQPVDGGPSSSSGLLLIGGGLVVAKLLKVF